jgi:hypothetical protein
MRLKALALGVSGLALLAGCNNGGERVATTASPSPSASATTAPTPVKPRVYPLTGLPVVDNGRAMRPALSVKIDNVADALPQAGLNQADIVTDILVEGGLTRLMATFQSQDASRIGPIRSARPVDADLLRELGGGIFAYSGADPREIAPVRAHSTAVLLSNDANGHWFHRDHSRPAPHNVFSSTGTLYQGGYALAHRKLGPPPQLFTYSATPASTRVVTGVRLSFSGFSTCAWRWDGHGYLRTQNGRRDLTADGSPVSTTNVVILSVTWRKTRIIDAAGNPDPYVVVTGSGPAYVMRNGRLIVGHWVRPTYGKPMRLLDAAGRTIALAPGRTWLELQPRPFVPSFS